MTDVQLQGYMQAFADKQRERYESLGRDVALNQAEIDELKLNAKANQQIIDGFAIGDVRRTSFDNKSFGSVWNDTIADVWKSRESELKNLKTDRHAKISFQLKVANMTMGAHLTGDGVSSYGPRQGLVPNQSVNMRDLIPAINSPTGIYVTYLEGASTGAFSVQTEGQPKTQIDYSFSEVKTVSDYTAAFAVVSKQMLYHLPFMQNTLPRMLLRDFYKKENLQIYGTIYAGATGNAVASTGSTNDSEELLDWISNQRDADFNASFVLVSWSDWNHLLKTGRNANSGYGVPGGVIFDNAGNMMIAGVPVIAASFVTAGEPLIVDRDYVERVTTEDVRVELSYEDEDNFRRNMVTFRCEAFQDINLLRADAHIAAEFGGS